MAFQQAFEYNGVPCPEAYFKILAIQARRTDEKTSIFIGIYYNKAASDAGNSPLSFVDELVARDNDSSFEWAYNQLKAMPQYAGAVDV